MSESRGSSPKCVVAFTVALGGVVACTEVTDDPVVEPEVVPQAQSDCDADVPYCDRTEWAGLATGAIFGKGASWVDVDLDGWEDLWLSDSGSGVAFWDVTSRLFHNDGDGSFSEMPIGLDADHLVQNWSGVWGDYDDDGDPDLFLVNGSFEAAAPCALYRNDLPSGGGFVDVTEAAGVLTDAEHWWGGSWADIENDGDLDLVVVGLDEDWDRPGRIVLYRNLGNGRFEESAETLGLEPLIGKAKNPVWIDYDRDGDPDLFLAGMGDDRFYRNDMPVGFVDVTAEVLDPLGLEPHTWVAAAADFDQDGWDDLYLGRYFEQDYVLRNQHDGTFRAAGRDAGLDMRVLSGGEGDPEVPDGELAEDTMGLGIGDIDDDGYPDVIIGTGDPVYAAPPILFCNRTRGALAFERCSAPFTDVVGASRHHGIAFADYDQDGDSDILLNRGGMIFGVPESASMYLVAIPDAPALVTRESATPPTTALVRLEGTVSNRSAVGARLEVLSSTRHYYTVRSSQAFQSQNGEWIPVQLGGPEAVVTATWPSGLSASAVLHAGDRVRWVEPEDASRPTSPVGDVRTP